MGAELLLNTFKWIARHRGGNRPRAFLRHLGWQFKRRTKTFPFEIPLTPKSKLFIEGPVSVSGGAAMAWSMGLYDFDNMAFFQDVLGRTKEPKTVLDIGANFGIYSLLASERAETRVFAFEPHPVTALICENNMRRNNRGNVTVVKSALSDKDGTLRFTNLPGSSINRLVTDGDTTTTGVVSVPIIRADTFCHENDIRPQVVKIDVEGHESEALNGFGKILEGVEMAFVEVNLPKELLEAHFPADRFTPWFPDFVMKVLRKEPIGQDQDVVFVKNTFLPELLGLGYSVAPGQAK